MCKAEVERGQNIADKIRQVLLNADLRLTYAHAEFELAQADFDLYSRSSNVNEQRKALLAKTRVECFARYKQKINEVKSEINIALNQILIRYTPKYKRIWTMYFLERASIQEISESVHYCPRNVDKIVQQFKIELNEFNGGKTNGNDS